MSIGMSWEDTEKYKTFSLYIEKVDKERNENIIIIFYKIKFIDSAIRKAI